MADDSTNPGTGGGSPTGSVTSQTTSSPAPSTPSVYELSDDSLISIKGSDGKPVKYGEHIHGFKSKLTRTTQELSRLQPEVKSLREQKAELERKLQILAGGTPSQPDPSQELLSKIEALPYLDGKSAKEVLSYIQSQLGGYKQEFSYRDELLKGVITALAQINKQVTGLTGSSKESAFKTKIANVLKSLDLDPEWEDLAVETYLAYEPGPNFDEEYPAILKARVEQVEKAAEARLKKRQAAARQASTFIPGRGGTATPKRPAEEKFESPQELARKFHRERRMREDGEDRG